MIRWLLYWLYGPHNCERHGHKYFARYDDTLDPRLSAEQIADMMGSPYQRDDICKARSKMYIRDICHHCGDTIDRVEGLNAMEVLAHVAKRIA